MRYIEIELESVQPLPALGEVSAAALPETGRIVACGGEPARIWFVSEGQARALELDAPGFVPRFLVDAGEGRVLAVGDGENSGVLIDSRGRLQSRLNLGEGIVDACIDADGNILVLRGAAPLLDRYGPDGDLVEDDPQLARIQEETRQEDGEMLLVSRDAALWLNLAEIYDREGAPLGVVDPPMEGRVAADLLGWDGIVTLDEEGTVRAMTSRGDRRKVRCPSEQVAAALGRPMSARTDVIVTREDHLWLLDARGGKLLAFRILSE